MNYSHFSKHQSRSRSLQHPAFISSPSIINTHRCSSAAISSILQLGLLVQLLLSGHPSLPVDLGSSLLRFVSRNPRRLQCRRSPGFLSRDRFMILDLDYRWPATSGPPRGRALFSTLPWLFRASSASTGSSFTASRIGGGSGPPAASACRTSSSRASSRSPPLPPSLCRDRIPQKNKVQI